jgi:predicted AAA+ superfamily ATPase
MISYRTLDIDELWNKMVSRDFEMKELVRRSAIEKIIGRFTSDHVEIIVGPRQSGKTTFLMMLIHELVQQGIPPERIYYINIDTIGELEQFKNPMLLLELIDRTRKQEERVYLFIDEVQRLRNPGRFLKGVYDLNPNIKLFATGSSSLELKSKIKEFLTGRKRETYLFPISFKEYIFHESKIPGPGEYGPLNLGSLEKWKQNQALYGVYLRRKMEEMALYGGYPAVLTGSGHEARTEELQEIYLSYVKKDIVDFLHLGNSELFTNLVKVLAAQVGNLINKSELSSLLGSSAVTITKYMNILKETFVAGYLPPYVSNRRNEVKGSQKCFFVDNGLRNFVIRQFGDFDHRPDKGALLENLFFSELVKDNMLLDEAMFYWRRKSGAEVDFVLRSEQSIIPVEIKSGPARPGLLSRSFHSFLDTFSPASAVFINKDVFEIMDIKQTRVYYIPGHWFLLSGKALLEGG